MVDGGRGGDEQEGIKTGDDGGRSAGEVEASSTHTAHAAAVAADGLPTSSAVFERNDKRSVD